MLWDIKFNNNVCLQWGQGKFYNSNGTSQTIYKITLPKANTRFTTACINADVGTSGFQYINGISIYSFTLSTSTGLVGCRLTEIQGRYACGNIQQESGMYFAWISIGY